MTNMFTELERSAHAALDVGEILPNRVARALAERHGIGVRWGCHCAHLLIKNMIHIPRALEELQRGIVSLSPKISLPGVVRVSFGIENTHEDIDTLIAALAQIARQRPTRHSEDAGLMEAFTAAAAQRVYAGGRT